jgi:NAD(P)-dependent dehydrogenase (short-subunit alcohol dehydrogenase family)
LWKQKKNMNKIALVTGGSRGLGRDMALSLAKAGNDIIITYVNNHNKANEVIQQITSMGQKAVALRLDVSEISSLDNFVDTFKKSLHQEFNAGHFDFLINNAGTGTFAMISDNTEAQFDEMLNIHFKGVYYLTQKLLPSINDSGSIINISTGLTRFSLPGMSAYACMKGAIEVFTRYLAKELGGRKIRANILAPGAIATDFAGGSNKADDKRELISGMTALGRVGEADDIGGVITFLCSEQAKWVNGQRIEVSGGMLL